MIREREHGVVLVNVLVILALGAGLIVLFLDAQETALSRGQLAANATQAEALVLGAEASVRTALLGDMQTAPETDHYAEPWANVQQQEVALETGRFSVTVSDANARYDINVLSRQDPAKGRAFVQLIAAVELPDDVAARILAGMARSDPLGSLAELKRFGVGADDIAILSLVADALPVPGSVNLNTAGPLVLAALFGDANIAQRLVGLRQRNDGQLTTKNLTGMGLIRPPRTGFTSNLWDVIARAEVDGSEVILRSRLLRRRVLTKTDVLVISRDFGDAKRMLPDPPDGLLD